MRTINLRNARHADGVDLLICETCDGIHIAFLDEDMPDDAFAQINLTREEAQRFATSIMGLLGKVQ